MQQFGDAFLCVGRLLTSNVMEKNTILIAIAAALAGFIGGFLFANSLNRSEMNAIRSQAPATVAANTAQPQNADGETLSDAEIQAKIDEADKNADNFTFQKNLGIGLYRYGSMKNAPKIVSEAARILIRANTLNPKDYEVLVALGNAQFDVGFFNKDAAAFAQARTTYGKALEQKPDDLDVQTDLGLTYFLQEPPDNAKAASTLEKVLAADPKHTRSMQFLVQTYTKQGKLDDAEKMLAKLKQLEPNNAQLGDLTGQIAAAKGSTKK